MVLFAGIDAGPGRYTGYIPFFPTPYLTSHSCCIPNSFPIHPNQAQSPCGALTRLPVFTIHHPSCNVS